MVGDVVLEARGLVKDYRRDRAVDDVSLTVHAGERVARVSAAAGRPG